MLAACAKGDPVGKSNSDEALQEHDSDTSGQQPVLAPRRRILASVQPVVNRRLVKAGGLARREMVQRRLIGRRQRRLEGPNPSLDGFEVQQRCFCFWCVLGCRAHFEVHGLRAKVVRVRAKVESSQS